MYLTVPETIFFVVVTTGTFLSLFVAKLRTGTFMSTALAYSSGWVVLALSHLYLKLFPGTREIPDDSFIVVSLVSGAGFLGIIAGIAVFGRNRTDYERMRFNFRFLERFLAKYYYYIVGLMFLAGLLAFFERFSMVGFSVFSLADLRMIHVSDSVTIFQRVAIYSTYIWYNFLILSALNDALRKKVNVWRLIFGISAILPLALSKASRGEFLAPILFYAIAILMVLIVRGVSETRSTPAEARSTPSNFVKKAVLRIVPLTVGVLVLATIYGQIRQVESKEYGGQYDLFGIVEAPIEVSTWITSYFVSSLYAAGPVTAWIDRAEPRLYGRRYFEVLYKVPEKTGLVPNYSEMRRFARQDAWNAFGEGAIAFTPGTMAKTLTREVGRKMAPVGAFFAMFLTVALTTLPRGYRIGGFVVSVVFLMDAFLSFQTLNGFAMSNVWMIAIGLAIGYCYQRYCRKMRDRGRALNAMASLDRT